MLSTSVCQGALTPVKLHTHTHTLLRRLNNVPAQRTLSPYVMLEQIIWYIVHLKAQTWTHNQHCNSPQLYTTSNLNPTAALGPLPSCRNKTQQKAKHQGLKQGWHPGTRGTDVLPSTLSDSGLLRLCGGRQGYGTQWMCPQGPIRSMFPLKHYLRIVLLSQHNTSCSSFFQVIL